MLTMKLALARLIIIIIIIIIINFIYFFVVFYNSSSSSSSSNNKNIHTFVHKDILKKILIKWKQFYLWNKLNVLWPKCLKCNFYQKMVQGKNNLVK